MVYIRLRISCIYLGLGSRLELVEWLPVVYKVNTARAPRTNSKPGIREKQGCRLSSIACRRSQSNTLCRFGSSVRFPQRRRTPKTVQAVRAVTPGAEIQKAPRRGLGAAWQVDEPERLPVRIPSAPDGARGVGHELEFAPLIVLGQKIALHR